MTRRTTLETERFDATQHAPYPLSRLDRLLEPIESLDAGLSERLVELGDRPLVDDGPQAIAPARHVEFDPLTSLHVPGDAPLDARDEVRLAKRIEFARLRLGYTIAAAEVSESVRERYLALCEAEASRFRGLVGSPGQPRLDAKSIHGRWREWLHFRNELIEHNLALVERIALRYRTYGIPHGDLVQHGNLGLIRAADKFDWRRNVRFRTYAEWWIRQSIERATDTDREVIHVPRPMRQKLSKANHLNRKQGGTRLDANRFAELMGIDREAAAHAFAIKSGIVSLDRAGPDDGRPMREDLIGPDLSSRDEHETIEHLRVRLGGMIGHLSDREREVLNLRFGLDGSEPRTLEEVGSKLGISRERVRQLQARAIDQLRVAVDDPSEF
jgi:RNA polymerase primary sigma factor